MQHLMHLQKVFTTNYSPGMTCSTVLIALSLHPF